jgi:hypothetical protein
MTKASKHCPKRFSSVELTLQYEASVEAEQTFKKNSLKSSALPSNIWAMAALSLV